MAEQKRGQLTDNIKTLSRKVFGYEMTQVELRLLPFLMHCAMDQSIAESDKTNEEEYDIIDRWRGEGYITSGYGQNLVITKKFWDMMTEIVYASYVDLKGKDDAN